ncbi:hypothetical protein PAAG_04880 [Paracoccidioides lutzii Pb01]|uniref:Uncharacterized protein n=1 Tax=Paracoccidioides lutzii (strain ATCC MYA-826 / Pb01) TaxID=502779 RepID=C1H1U4_PARBA|nr:hypothetical protein PAAG_04880 [Paracoccidioides lutzii Pb01]EEH33831.2 hypothetical protein PAAG_04880 [Paracoccidioides lutzii Pb01]
MATVFVCPSRPTRNQPPRPSAFFSGLALLLSPTPDQMEIVKQFSQTDSRGIALPGNLIEAIKQQQSNFPGRLSRVLTPCSIANRSLYQLLSALSCSIHDITRSLSVTFQGDSAILAQQ